MVKFLVLSMQVMGVVPNIQSRLYSIASASEIDRVKDYNSLITILTNAIPITGLSEDYHRIRTHHRITYYRIITHS